MRRRRTLKPWLFGIIAGSLFVAVEALAGVYPPSAYGFCLTCHARDLVGSVINALFGTNVQTALVARRMLMITSPAVLLGAWLAALCSGERRVLRSDRPLGLFALGFAVMTTGLIIFGCPTRIVLRAGYGEWYGMVALAGMVSGITGATFLVRWAGRAGVALPVLRPPRHSARGAAATPSSRRPDRQPPGPPREGR